MSSPRVVHRHHHQVHVHLLHLDLPDELFPFIFHFDIDPVQTIHHYRESFERNHVVLLLFIRRDDRAFPLQFYISEFEFPHVILVRNFQINGPVIKIYHGITYLSLASDISVDRLGGSDGPLVFLICSENYLQRRCQVQDIARMQSITDRGISKGKISDFQVRKLCCLRYFHGYGTVLRVDTHRILTFHGKGYHLRIHVRIGHIVLFQT